MTKGQRLDRHGVTTIVWEIAMLITVEKIMAAGPCYAACEVKRLVGDGLTPAQLAQLDIPIEDRLWVLTKCALDDRQARLFMCDCVEHSLPRILQSRPQLRPYCEKVLATAWWLAQGEVTPQEVAQCREEIQRSKTIVPWWVTKTLTNRPHRDVWLITGMNVYLDADEVRFEDVFNERETQELRWQLERALWYAEAPDSDDPAADPEALAYMCSRETSNETTRMSDPRWNVSMLDIEYLDRAIRCSGLLPAPGDREVQTIASSHIAAMRKINVLRARIKELEQNLAALAQQQDVLSVP